MACAFDLYLNLSESFERESGRKLFFLTIFNFSFIWMKDNDIWQALEDVQLKTFCQGLKNGLNEEVTEGGSSLSVGQRQLICIARVLLRKVKSTAHFCHISK